jgi:hypothetical protein
MLDSNPRCCSEDHYSNKHFSANFVYIPEFIHNFRNWCFHLYSGCSSVTQQYMIVLAYLESYCTERHAAGWKFWSFTSSYLESWDFAMNSTKDQYRIMNKSRTETQAIIRQASVEESMSHTRKVQSHRDRKRETQMQSKVKSVLVICFDIKGLHTKNSSWQAKQ